MSAYGSSLPYMSVYLLDAAHKYGLDNYDVSGSLVQAAQVKWGTIVSQTAGTTTHPVYGYAQDYLVTRWSNGYVTNVKEDFDLAVLTLVKEDTDETLWYMNGKLTKDMTLDRLADLQDAALNVLTVTGNAWNNILGNTAVTGGGRSDTALYDGVSTGHRIYGSQGAVQIDNSWFAVERVRFNDLTMAWDPDGEPGQAYRLYQAAFNRVPDSPGLGYQVHALDSGASLIQVAGNFIASPEFARAYGPISEEQFVTRLYANVLFRKPDAQGLAYHVGNLERHEVTRADVLVGFSESPENKAQLVGVLSLGISYDNV